jgi:hypothetical protein
LGTAGTIRVSIGKDTKALRITIEEMIVMSRWSKATRGRSGEDTGMEREVDNIQTAFNRRL